MTSHRHRIAVAALAPALMLLGCSSGGSNPTRSQSGAPSTTTDAATATPTSPAPTQLTQQELAERALTEYFRISEKAQRTGKLKHLLPLSKVATGDAYFSMRQFVNSYFVGPKADRLRGRVQHSLTDVVMSGPARVIITDCQDWTNAKIVMLKTGKEVPFVDADGNPRPERFKTEYGIARVQSRDWRVETIDERWDQTC